MQTLCFITLPEINKADAIVDATRHSAQVLKGETESNIRDTSINQLQQLVEAISNIGTIQQDAWVAQKSNTIPMTNK